LWGCFPSRWRCDCAWRRRWSVWGGTRRPRTPTRSSSPTTPATWGGGRGPRPRSRRRGAGTGRASRSAPWSACSPARSFPFAAWHASTSVGASCRRRGASTRRPTAWRDAVRPSVGCARFLPPSAEGLRAQRQFEVVDGAAFDRLGARLSAMCLGDRACEGHLQPRLHAAVGEHLEFGVVEEIGLFAAGPGSVVFHLDPDPVSRSPGPEVDGRAFGGPAARGGEQGGDRLANARGIDLDRGDALVEFRLHAHALLVEILLLVGEGHARDGRDGAGRAGK